MRAQISGKITLADAQYMGEMLKPGQQFHKTLILNLIDKSTEYTPDSRHYFQSMRGNYLRMASVVTSPVIRAVINFQLRIAGQAEEFRLFDTEASAMTWLEAK